VSERSFFNIRYNFPGYTFLLFTILICFKELNVFIKDTNSNLFIAFFVFFYLLSGACIGFIISQAWYILIYNGLKLYYYKESFAFCRKRKPRSYMNFLHYKFRIKKDDIEKATVALDFIYNNYKKEHLRSYVNRRWDLYQTMGPIQGSILIGIIVGLIIKFVLLMPLIINIIDILFILWVIDIGILLVTAFSIVIEKIVKEHDDMTKLILWDCLQNKQLSIYKDTLFKYFEMDKRLEF